MSIEEQVRAQHPTFIVREDKANALVSPETDPERYEAMIADRVAWAEAAEQVAINAAADATARQAIIDALAELDQIQAICDMTANLTQTQIKGSLGSLASTVEQIIRYLHKRGVLGQDG